MRVNQTRFVRPLRIRYIRVLSGDPFSDYVRVEYILESQITEERAAYLRSVGYLDTRAGRRVSVTTRTFVRDGGVWKMLVLPN
jgi:hypothetical protein